MAIVIPGNAVNYPNALLAVGLKQACVPVGQKPENGPQCVPMEIDWGTMGGASFIVGANIGNAGATRAFEDICAVKVDNSGCGSDIRIIFTDTQDTITVPAGMGYFLAAVFTKALQFYVIAGVDGNAVESSDITRVTLLNFVPPPLSVALDALEDTNATGGAFAVDAVTTHQLVAAGNTGTVSYLTVTVVGLATATGIADFIIQDGGGKQIGAGAVSAKNGDSLNCVTVLSLQNIGNRFNNGLQFVQGGAPIAGLQYFVNLGFRTP